MKKLFVVLPCYNEEKDIANLVDKWIDIDKEVEKLGYDLKVYCINDCSRDNTLSVINRLVEKYPQKVSLINHEINKGLGGVLSTGFNMFFKKGEKGDLCVVMDGDNTHDPIYTLSMFNKVDKGSDCVIASRYCNTSEVKGVPVMRLFMSWGAKAYYTMMLNIKNVKDYTCGYRMYTYDIIEKAINRYGKNFVENRSFACMMEVLYKLSRIGAEFDEVPFELRYDNKEGESKMRIANTVQESLKTAFELRLKKHKGLI